MIKTKLTKKQTVFSAIAFLLCHLGLILVLFLMLLINYGGGITSFIQSNVANIITVVIAATILSVVVYFFFLVENKALLANKKKILEIYVLLYVSLILTDVFGKYVSTTARPLLFYPLIICMFLRRREAIFLNTAYMLLQFVFSHYLGVGIAESSVQMIDSFSELLTIFCGGVVGIFVLKNVKTRLGCVLVCLVLFIPALLINLTMQLPFVFSEGWTGVWENLVFSLFDCILSVLLFMCILPIAEGLFSELTPFRLRELTSDNAKLIKKLKQHALGTYNHSVVVAQLAEACASAIGEDAELVRAVAYYHDVGKLKNPEMFAENQTEYDLHKELTPELSVDIIRSHTKEGAKLIKKNRLPEIFADVAVEHHGTMPIKYFYAKALNLSDGELNVGNYSYTGPTPTTKIAAIIMIADASEAATRSLSDRSPEKVAELVVSIVEERMNLEQFNDCDITMRELSLITRTCINQLAGVYHSRVKYPKLTLSRN